MKIVTVFIAALLLAAQAWSHGGEDHSHDAAPALAQDAAPRAVAQTEDFELVAVLAGGRLTVYLDRYADNAPIADAEIELESGAAKAVAVQMAPGVYALPGDPFARPGKHPLTFSVQAGDTADLLTATLELAAPVALAAHETGWRAWTLWGAAGSLLLASVGLVAVRRKQKQKH